VATKCNIYVLDGLDEEGNDIVKVSFNKIKARRGDNFDWHVFNLSSTPHTIILSDFTRLNVPANPFTTNPPFVVNPTPLHPGDDSKSIKVKVDPAATFGSYLYNIYVDGRITVDPELDIEGALRPSGKDRKKAAKKEAANKAKARTSKK
jgi:hypothetical protein